MKISVSILMPVYNGKAHLEDAINSILKQTYRDFELITVDDASSDGSLSILQGYAKQDSRIKVITNNKNIGLTRSLIKAIEMAQGRYLARQDADDISLPQRLEKQIDFLENNKEYGAIGTSARVIGSNGDFIRNAYVPKTWFMTRQILRFGNCFLHGSMMFRKEAYIDAGGYRSSFSLGQDFDLWLRISKKSKMRNMHEILYCWRETGDNSFSSIKTDTQFKIAALALYDHRYDKQLELDDDFEINSFIDDLCQKDRREFNSCLRDICLRHGNIAMARKYLDRSIINVILIMLTDAAFRVRRINRKYNEE